MFSKWLEPIRSKIPPDLDLVEASRLQQAITEEALSRLAAFLAGVKAYQNFEAGRDEPGDVREIWRAGTTRLLDYAPDSKGVPVLVVPSLVNRFEILDLDYDRSFLRAMAQSGLRPVVIDWSAPGDEERNFSLADYMTKRLVPALALLSRDHGDAPVHVLGYCMGGVMSLALALMEANKVRSLSLMATPWDFAGNSVGGVPPAGTMLGQMFMSQAQNWETYLEKVGYLPTDFLQSVFTSFQPLRVLSKFMSFAQADVGDDQSRRFVLTEDWLNDGVPLALPVAKECLRDWYGQNLTGQNKWHVAGVHVDPAKISVPSYVLIGGRDRIVPRESSEALLARLPGAHLHEPMMGHIGLMSGDAAPHEVWVPLFTWLQAH